MKRTARYIFSVLRVAAAAVLLLWLFRSGAIEWSAIPRLVAAWPFALGALIVLAVQMVLISWRVCVLLKPYGRLHLPLGAAIRLTLIGTSFTACLPGGASGDVVRIYYATGGHKGHRAELTAILLLDRAVGMFALICWPLIALPFFLRVVAGEPVVVALLWGAGAIAAVMAAFVGLAMWTGTPGWSALSGVLDRVPLVGSVGRRMLETVHLYRRHLGPLAAALGISLIAHTLVVAATLLVAAGMNPDGFSWTMSLMVPLGFLVNTLPLTPGGIGVGEAAMDQLFGLIGVAGGAEALLGWRIVMLPIILLGFACYARGGKQFVQDITLQSAEDPSVQLAGVLRES